MTGAAAVPDFEFRGVSLGYGRRPVVTGLDLALYPGERLGLLGPNGCGKTTILKALLGILSPTCGTVTRRAGVRIGFVPQRERFDPVWPLTAEEVVLQGLLAEKGLFARFCEGDRLRVRATLAETGVEDRASVPFRELSGGQQQRVLLSRALVIRPDWLVLDEPTAGMDLTSQDATLHLIDRLQKDRGMGVLLVTHQLGDVADTTDRIAAMSQGTVRVLETAAAFSGPALSELYGLPLECLSLHGHRVVVRK